MRRTAINPVAWRVEFRDVDGKVWKDEATAARTPIAMRTNDDDDNGDGLLDAARVRDGQGVVTSKRFGL